MKSLLTALAFGVIATAQAKADDVTSAEYLCAVVDSTGLASDRCEMSVWNSAIIATIDMSGGEARDLCGKITGFMRDNRRTFGRDWTFQIRSPYSGESSIAFCPLPRG